MSTFVLSATLALTLSTAISAEVGIRRDVLDLSEAEKEAFLQGLYKMKSTPSKYNSSWSTYDYYAWVHRYAFEQSEAGAFGHNRWNFLPWHRGFAYLFEQELQEAMNDASFRLPYWDLTNEASTFAVLNDESFLGGSGDVNDSYMLANTTRLNCEDWSIDPRLINGTRVGDLPCLARSVGVLRDSLSPKDEWWKLLDAGYDYDVEPFDDFVARDQNITQTMAVSFRARLEGMRGLFCNATSEIACASLHNGIHGYIGGHIASPSSPIDPVFILLHNWIDAMWALYQDEYGLEYTFPEQFKHTAFFDGWFNNSQMNSMDVMDTTDLGYVYQVQIDRASTTGEDDWWTVDRIVIVSAIAAAVLVVVCCICLIQRANKAAPTGNYQQI